MDISKSYAYREAYSEVYFILLNMEWSDVKKIPKDIIKIISKNRIKNYDVNINPYIPLESQQLKEETKAILALFYRKFWCPNDKKEIVEREFKENLKKEKSLNNIEKTISNIPVKEIEEFENIIESNKLMVKKENWFTKLLKFLKISTK